MTLVGQHMGRYRILEEVGSGGMSVVYRAVDTSLDRVVALKVLHRHLAQKRDARQRLAQEARAVAKLHHPNILEVFDVSVTEGQDAFLVTEFIQGRTLKQFVEDEPLHPPELAALAIHELAAALAHAHGAGVIHRDIKPENVMVRADGRLKLMDFGIAKLLDRDERMTQTGALVGSPAHMAPEIIEGHEASAASDVFSLGTMLYALATGALPFSASNTTATLKRILDGDYPDPRERSRAVSDELAAIIARCLARRPEDRFPHAAGLQEALMRYVEPLGLGRPAEELEAFFASPRTYRTALVQRLLATWLTRAEAHLRAQRPARALALLDQVLALEPGHPRALALVAETNRRRRRRRKARQAATVLLGVGLALSAGLWSAQRLVRLRPRPSVPGAAATGASNQPGSTASPPQRGAPGAPGEATAERAPGTKASGEQRASSPAPKPERPHRTAPPSPAVSPGEVPVRILIRPYGFVQVDRLPRSAEPLTQHDLKLAPGKHRVVVSCVYCETSSETVDVKAGADNIFPLAAQVKPSTVSFAYEPPEALIRVGAEQRSSAQSQSSPFVVRAPRGAVSFQNPLEFEVSAPGFRTERKKALLVPGQTTVLSGKLEPE